MNFKKNNLISFIILILLIVPDYGQCFPTIPARIFGNIFVNNMQLSEATDTGYSIIVTNSSGVSYSPAAEDLDGFSAESYLIDIPIYDADDQPGGANTGESAIIHLFRKGEEAEVTSPSGGVITVGSQGSFTMITITADVNISNYKQSISGGNQTSKGIKIKTGGGKPSEKLIKITY